MQHNQAEKPIVGISMGDYNGIGPEVILKALDQNQLNGICTPVIYGSMKVLSRYRQLLQLRESKMGAIQQPDQANPKWVNVINCWNDQQTQVEPGKVTPEAGKAAWDSLKRATDDLKEGKIQALITAPINKDNIQSESFRFPGHTEFLAETFGVQDALMLMVADELRVGVLTGHIPLDAVKQAITPERLTHKLLQMIHSMRVDFDIPKPKIAVLGLNPHAGENGLLGSEEIDIISPTLEQLKQQGQLVFGPFPSDGFFASRSYQKYDAILAMYHDQGLIPFKTLAFNEGVNFTAGLPVVRTSPDHGTAYDIAGKNVAEPDSLRHAIYVACDVLARRAERNDQEAHALVSKPQPSESQHPSKKKNFQKGAR